MNPVSDRNLRVIGEESLLSSASNPMLKDIDATLDYIVDWTDALEEFSDTLVTGSWAVTPNTGLTVESSGLTGASLKSRVWLASGTVDQVYAVQNRIVTAQGRKDDRTFYIRVI